ncbi:kinase-like domain-containing protein [Nemania sp. FL0916]|nr:kinase-like domain-containing protein [Nemania sp. FL0916]
MESPVCEDAYSTSTALPPYARVENISNYVVGGFHPIHFGDQIGPDERFEVHHKLGYSDACTVWLCLNRSDGRRVAVKVFRADKSAESETETEALHLFEGMDRAELEANHMFPVDEYFWIDGPNGHHICFIVQILGPAISYGLPEMDLDTPDFLTDVCFQAARGLKYLHDKKVCHGDFRPDHMRMQLNLEAMSEVKIYDLLGEPKVWHLTDHHDDGGGGQPRYLAEPADMADLERNYRTGKIAVDSFSSSYREGDATKPQISDIHCTAPETCFLNKFCGMSSDIWVLASTIHLIRTTKLLLARLESKSSLVSWLTWAYGPFPQEYWGAIGEYLSADSAVPVFTVKTISQEPPLAHRTQVPRQTVPKIDKYVNEWGFNRDSVVALLLGEEETPRSIWRREMLQNDKDRSKYLRIKLPKNSNVWNKFQEQRKQVTGYKSLLHEDLSKERQWYQDTDALNGEGQYTPQRPPSGIDDATLQRLNGTWSPGQVSKPSIGDLIKNDKGNVDAPEEEPVSSIKSSEKRPLPETSQEVEPDPKRAKKFITEHNLRDQVERVEQYDGMTRFSYRLQPREVDLLADLLGDMLKNDPNERISVDTVLQHKWFDASRTRLERM